MGLGLSFGNGEAIVKYDARAGRVFVDDKDVTANFVAAFDFHNIEVGWVLFRPAMAPDFQTVRLGSAFPAQPTKEHKQCFRMRVKLPQHLGGSVREWSSTAACVIQSMDELQTEVSNAPEYKAGKLPVVRLVGSVPVTKTGKAGTSTNYKPTLAVQSWTDRPAELSGAPRPEPYSEPKPNNAPTPGAPHASTPVPPPAPAPIPAGAEAPVF